MNNRKRYRTVNMKGKAINYLGEFTSEHRLLAAKALGKQLPVKCDVHHHSDTQLVICENRSYHMLLHRRQKAFEACGHASWNHCCDCDTYKPDEEMRSSDKNLCRECDGLRSKKYYKENKIQMLAQNKAYRNKNKVKVVARQKKWEGNNIERLREYRRAYYLKNREKILAYGRERRLIANAN